MNKPQRSIEYLMNEGTTVDTAIAEAFMNSAVGRIAQLEVRRFNAATKFQPPASSNGTVSATESEPAKDIGADLRAVARAKHVFDPGSMNTKSRKMRSITFSPIKEWEGYVVDVVRDHMIANLVDLTAHENRPSSTVEIPLEELEPADIERLRPGMIFRWAIGYLRTPSGTRKRSSNIVFRNLPRWTKQELAEAKKEAAEMAKYFSSGDHESNTR
jgi:hypothetical protein